VIRFVDRNQHYAQFKYVGYQVLVRPLSHIRVAVFVFLREFGEKVGGVEEHVVVICFLLHKTIRET
jgi:hypothetical protein